MEKGRWVGYLLAPVGLAIRVGVVALLVQGVGMLLEPELRLGAAFTAALAGGFATLYGTWMTLLWLWRAGPDGISFNVLGVVPASLAGWLMAPEASRTVLYRTAAEVSLASACWIVLVGLALQTQSRCTWRSGLAVAACTWLGLAASRTALSVAVIGLFPGA
jgi:hypothetical protein